MAPTKYQPHVHQVQMRRLYAAINKGPWFITYGDQSRQILFSSHWTYLSQGHQRRINRIVRKLVRRHDRETAEALARAESGGPDGIIERAQKVAMEASVVQ